MNTTLHIVNRLENGKLPEALARCWNEGDALLLTCDAVYAALNTNTLLPSPCFALESDIAARGLKDRWPANVTAKNYSGFVDLCVQYPKSLSWG